MKYVDIRDLPPCSLSPECLRLIDDLDMPMMSRPPARLAHIQDLQDRRQLRQLRSHVPNCPTCSAVLIEARRTRTQQHTMLRHFLLANERQVPSTTESILAALRREQAQAEDEWLARPANPYKLHLVVPELEHESEQSLPTAHSRSSLHRNVFQNFLTLATIAAVILAAVGLLNRFTDPTSSSSSSKRPQLPGQPNTALSNPGLDSMVIGLTLLSASGLARSFTMYSFNALSSQVETLFSGNSSIVLDDFSQDGQTLLYEEAASDMQQMHYGTFSAPAHTQKFYHVGLHQAGNAIWMDDDHVLVQSTDGEVVSLNLVTGNLQRSWSIQANRLVFYHEPFLYFVAAETPTTQALYRVDLSLDVVIPEQITTSPLPDTRYWLSPDGTTIYYADWAVAGKEGIYAVNSDGVNQRLVHQGKSLPIGYAADGSLMLLQQVGANVEVIKLGTTPHQPDQVVLTNAAPAATSLCQQAPALSLIALCDENISLTPSGRGLLLHAYYADGSHSLIYDDLSTGLSYRVMDLAAQTRVQLAGWSQGFNNGGKTTLAAADLLCA